MKERKLLKCNKITFYTNFKDLKGYEKNLFRKIIDKIFVYIKYYI